MTRKTRTIAFIAPLALLAGSLAAAPAAAQQPYSPRELRAQLSQLDREIVRIGRSDRYTPSEYRQLSNRVDTINMLISRAGRDGYTRRELHNLSDRIDALRYDVRAEARDGDRYYRR